MILHVCDMVLLEITIKETLEMAKFYAFENWLRDTIP